MSELKSFLFSKYDGFADKRIKDLAKSNAFIVDDRTVHDKGADKSLFGTFCAVYLDIIDEDNVSIRLVGNLPGSPKIDDWITKNSAILKLSSSITFSVHRGCESIIEDLANHISSIVAPGAKYKVASYKYMCPRTAKTLKKLARNLHTAWNQ